MTTNFTMTDQERIAKFAGKDKWYARMLGVKTYPGANHQTEAYVRFPMWMSDKIVKGVAQKRRREGEAGAVETVELDGKTHPNMLDWAIRACPTCGGQPEHLGSGRWGCGRHMGTVDLHDFTEAIPVAPREWLGRACVLIAGDKEKRDELVETFRTMLALAHPNPEARGESLAYRVAELEQRLRAIRGLAHRDLAPYGAHTQSAPICGAAPWQTSVDAPHLLCAQPRGHDGDHRAGDGLTWPRRSEPRLTGPPAESSE